MSPNEAGIGRIILALAKSSSSRFPSIPEFPGSANLANGPKGIVTEKLKLSAEVTFVPFVSTGPAVNALLGKKPLRTCA